MNEGCAEWQTKKHSEAASDSWRAEGGETAPGQRHAFPRRIHSDVARNGSCDWMKNQLASATSHGRAARRGGHRERRDEQTPRRRSAVDDRCRFHHISLRLESYVHVSVQCTGWCVCGGRNRWASEEPPAGRPKNEKKSKTANLATSRAEPRPAGISGLHTAAGW